MWHDELEKNPRNICAPGSNGQSVLIALWGVIQELFIKTTDVVMFRADCRRVDSAFSGFS